MKTLTIAFTMLFALSSFAGEAICLVDGDKNPIAVPYDGPPVPAINDLHISIRNCEMLNCTIHFSILDPKNKNREEPLFVANYSKSLSSEHYEVYGVSVYCKDSRTRQLDKKMKKVGDEMKKKIDELKKK